MVDPIAGHRVDAAAVAEHGDTVGDGEHLVEVMRHEHNGETAVPQLAKHAEQPPDVVGRQRGGRFVENQHPGRADLVMGRPGDRHDRPLG